jgi:hypothetical protein
MESSEVSSTTAMNLFQEEGQRMEGHVPVTFGTMFAFGFVSMFGFGCLVLVVVWLLRRRRVTDLTPNKAKVQSTRRIHLDGKVENAPNNDTVTLTSSMHSAEHALAIVPATSTLRSPNKSIPSLMNQPAKVMIPIATNNPVDEEDDDGYHHRLEENPLQVKIAPVKEFSQNGGTESAAKEYRRACRSNRQRLEEMVPGDEELGLARLEAVPPTTKYIGANFWWKTRECPPPPAVSVSSDSDDDDDDDDSVAADLQRNMAEMGILVNL